MMNAGLGYRKPIDARDEIVAFVVARLDGKGAGEYLGFFTSSFNLRFYVRFGERLPGALIRFAIQRPLQNFPQSEYLDRERDETGHGLPAAQCRRAGKHTKSATHHRNKP